MHTLWAVTFERWRWYWPDHSWKHSEPAPASREARRAKIEATVLELLAGLTGQFGEALMLDLQLEHESGASPAFRLVRLDQRAEGWVAVLEFADGGGGAEVPCSQISAVRAQD